MNDQFNIITEQYVLRCIYEKNNFLLKVKDYFISEIGKNLYKVLVYLHKNKININKVNILRESTKYKVFLSEENFNTFLQIEYDIKSFDKYYEDLKKAHIFENLRLKEIKNVVTLIESKGNIDIQRIQENLDIASNKIKKTFYTKRSHMSIIEWIEDYKDIVVRRGTGEFSFPFGCYYLDKYATLGISPGYLTTIFATSGSGKSTYKTYLLNKEINLGIPVVNNTLEMTAQSEMDRLVARRTGLSIDFLLNRQNSIDASDQIYSIVEKEEKKLKLNGQFRIIDDPSQTLNDLDFLIPELKEIMNVPFFVMHIDLATMIKDFKIGRNTQASIYEEAVDRLAEIARKHSVHFILYVQSLRDSKDIKIHSIEDIEKFRPRLQNIKNSSAFEERSRLVLGLFRPKYYADRYLKDDPEIETMIDIMEVNFLKQSMGKVPRLNYYFQGSNVKILPYEDEIGKNYNIEEKIE